MVHFHPFSSTPCLITEGPHDPQRNRADARGTTCLCRPSRGRRSWSWRPRSLRPVRGIPWKMEAKNAGLPSGNGLKVSLKTGFLNIPQNVRVQNPDAHEKVPYPLVIKHGLLENGSLIGDVPIKTSIYGDCPLPYLITEGLFLRHQNLLKAKDGIRRCMFSNVLS